jgi:hypothetical protein
MCWQEQLGWTGLKSSGAKAHMSKPGVFRGLKAPAPSVFRIQGHGGLSIHGVLVWSAIAMRAIVIVVPVPGHRARQGGYGGSET